MTYIARFILPAVDFGAHGRRCMHRLSCSSIYQTYKTTDCCSEYEYETVHSRELEAIDAKCEHGMATRLERSVTKL